MDPINYSLNIQDPTSAFMQSANVGANIAANQAQKEASIEQKKLLQAEQMASAWKQKNAQQQQEALQFGGQALAAIRNGSPQIARDMIAQKAAAARNSGDEKTAQAYDTWSKIIEINPSQAADTVESMIAAHPEGKALIDNINSMQEGRRKEALFAPQLKTEQAEAEKKTAEANIAPEMLSKDLEKKGWDISKIQSDMENDKLLTKIKVLEAQSQKALDPLKKQELELKIANAKTEQADAIKGKVSTLESAKFNIDNTINTIGLLENHPGKSNALGVKKAYIPTLQQDTADFEEQLKTLGSQVFLSQVPQMAKMGQLTENEGAKLQASFQALATRQGDKQFDRNLAEAKRLMLKMRKNISDKYGMPQDPVDTEENRTNIETAKNPAGRSYMVHASGGQ